MRKKKDEQIRRKNATEGDVLKILREINSPKVPTKIVTRIFKAKGREDAVEGRRKRQMPDPDLSNRVAKLPITTRMYQADMV